MLICLILMPLLLRHYLPIFLCWLTRLLLLIDTLPIYAAEMLYTLADFFFAATPLITGAFHILSRFFAIDAAARRQLADAVTLCQHMFRRGACWQLFRCFDSGMPMLTRRDGALRAFFMRHIADMRHE